MPDIRPIDTGATAEGVLARAIGRLQREVADLRATLLARLAATPPTGSLVAWTTTTAPSGWLIADGSAVSRTDYAGLFAVIGETYGVGDGSTTFNLPNLKGRMPVGLDPADGWFDVLGLTGGGKTHALTVAEMPNHNHAWVGVNDSAATTGQAGTYSFRIYQDVAINWNGTRAAMSGEGGGQAHNNMPPYLALHYIVKT